MKRRIIILGKTGLIGGSLFRNFSSSTDYEVVGFSSADCNLLSFDSAQKALEGLGSEDIVIMAAGITRLKEDTYEALEKNIRMVENLLRVVVPQAIRQLIYISTTDVYGSLEETFKHESSGPEIKMNEDFALRPDGYYAIGKVACEFLLKKGLCPKGTILSILRFPGVFGPHPCDRTALGRFIRSAIQEQKITIYGDGNDLRDYIYAGDVYAAVCEAIRTGFNGEVNVVSPRSYSIGQMAEMIQSYLKEDCSIELVDSPSREKEQPRLKRMQFDDTRLAESLPQLKIRDLSEGIGLCIKNLRAERFWGQEAKGGPPQRDVGGGRLEAALLVTEPRKKTFNADLRKKIVDVVYNAQAGHIPSAFSIIDILEYLYARVLKFDPQNPAWLERDYFILSKGHGCVALYVLLKEYGFIIQDDLDRFMQFDGILGGHPDSTKVPGVEGSTGSLGHGMGTAVGAALGLRIKNMNNRVFVLIGDGETNEGTVWECALVAGHLKLGNLCCVVDNNGSADQILPVEPLKEKWESFGWETHIMDGHDPKDMARIFDQLRFKSVRRPKAIVANTRKGKGVGFMEVHGPWHYRAPNAEELELIYKELDFRKPS